MLRRFSKVITGGAVLLFVGLVLVRVDVRSAAAAERGDTIVAKFEGGRITVADVERAASLKVAHQRARYAAEGGREQLLTELVRWELLVREAQRRGYEDHPAVYEATSKAAVNAMQEQIAIDPASIESEELARYYEAHEFEFRVPAARRASMIKVATEAEARALIRELEGVGRVRFAAVARERSIDEATRRQGGELGYFDHEGRQRKKSARKSVASVLVEAAFALAGVGSVSKVPLAYEGGYVVLMLTGQMRAIDRSVAQAEGEIRERVALAASKRAVEALLARIRKEQGVQVNEGLLDLIALDDVPTRDIPQGFPAAPPDPYAPPITVEPDDF
jgi:parvulin-like peptidyl-prolyl isomerase